MHVSVIEIKRVRKPGPCKLCGEMIHTSAYRVWVEPNEPFEDFRPYGYRCHVSCANEELREHLYRTRQRRAYRKKLRARRKA